MHYTQLLFRRNLSHKREMTTILANDFIKNFMYTVVVLLKYTYNGN